MRDSEMRCTRLRQLTHPALLNNINAAPLPVGPPYSRTDSTDHPRARSDSPSRVGS